MRSCLTMPEHEDDPLLIAAAAECMRTGKMVRAGRDETGEYIQVVEERFEENPSRPSRPVRWLWWLILALWGYTVTTWLCR